MAESMDEKMSRLRVLMPLAQQAKLPFLNWRSTWLVGDPSVTLDGTAVAFELVDRDNGKTYVISVQEQVTEKKGSI